MCAEVFKEITSGFTLEIPPGYFQKGSLKIPSPTLTRILPEIPLAIFQGIPREISQEFAQDIIEHSNSKRTPVVSTGITLKVSHEFHIPKFLKKFLSDLILEIDLEIVPKNHPKTYQFIMNSTRHAS